MNEQGKFFRDLAEKDESGVSCSPGYSDAVLRLSLRVKGAAFAAGGRGGRPGNGGRPAESPSMSVAQDLGGKKMKDGAQARRRRAERRGR